MMKRPLLIVVIALPLLLVLVFGSYWLLGSVTEAGVKKYFKGENPLEVAKLELASYERGFFKSRATSSITLFPDEDPIVLINEIYHGPFALVPGGAKVGSGHVVTTLDVESLPEEAREQVADIFQGKEPIVIDTSVAFGGARTSTVSLAAIDHEKDGVQIRFDGGSGEFTFSPDNSKVEGQFAVEPLSLRYENEDEGNTMRIRLERSLLKLDTSSSAATVESTTGKISFAITGETHGGFEVEEMQFRSNFSPAAPESKVMLGSGKFTIPSATVSWTSAGDENDKGSIAMKGFSLEVKVSEAGGLVTNSADYSVASMTVDSNAFEGSGAYADLLAEGAQFSASASLPREIVEDLAAFQTSFNSSVGLGASFASPEMRPEQAEELARVVESSFRRIVAGTGFQIAARLGSAEAGATTSFAYTYRGARPLTSQKSYIEVIEASEMRLESRVPKSLFGDSPEVLERVQGVTAMGAVKDDGANLMSALVLKGTELTANGEPLPLLENFLPILSTEISWDGIFTGLQAGAAAHAEAAREAGEETPEPAEE